MRILSEDFLVFMRFQSVYQFIDWRITVPLQMIKLSWIIKAAGSKIGACGFWRILTGTVTMLVIGPSVRRTSTYDLRRWLRSWHVWLDFHPFQDSCTWAF